MDEVKMIEYKRQMIGVGIALCVGMFVGIVIFDAMFDELIWKIIAIIGLGLWGILIGCMFASMLYPKPING